MPVLIKGSNFINGSGEELLKTYNVSADGPITAGDLCEFVNNQVRKTKLKTVNMSLQTDLKENGINRCKATVLDSTHVLLVSNDATTNLYAQMIAIDEAAGTISKGTKVQITTDTVLLPGFDVCANSSTLAIVAYKNTANSYITILPLTISGTIITAGAKVTDTGRGNTTEIALVKYANNQIMMFSMYGEYLNYAAIFISGGIPSLANQLDNWLSDSYFTPSRLKAKIVSNSGANTYVLAEKYGLYNYNGEPQPSYNNKVYCMLIQISSFSGGLTNRYNVVFQRITVDRVLDYGVSNNIAGKFAAIFIDLNSNFLSVRKQSITLNSDGTVTNDFPTDQNVYQTLIRNACANLNIFQYDTDKHIIYYTGNPYGSIYSAILNFSGLDCVSITTPIQQNSVNSQYIEPIKLNSGNVLIMSADSTNSNLVRLDFQQVLRDQPRPFKVLGYEDPRGVALNSANVGEPVKLLIKGIGNAGKTLSPGCKYYCDENGNLTTTVTPYYVGTALNANELEVENAWWNRGL